MLPRELSSHLCSLVAHQDRLCLAVEVVLDATGTPLRHRFVEGVMRNRAKLSYEDAARALGWVKEEPSEHALALLGDLKIAAEASAVLRARRMRRGALDFDLPEAKVKVDATGQVIDVVRSRADPGVKKAYNLIEELMLLGNEVVAEELAHRSVPTVYRVHGRPDEERLDRFANLAETLGFSFQMEDANDPKALGKFLRLVGTHPRAEVLNSLLLRAMKQATYDVVNIGHFGLASKAYLHFTSPIRRYPDLVVHRAVHRICQGDAIERDQGAIEALKEAALQASIAERKAMDVEREVVDLHRALLMRTRIGQELDGAVSAVVGSGLFVALDAPYVDVLVRFEALGSEPYEMDEEGLAAVGKRSGDVIHLGDRMRVRIDDVSITRRQVYGMRVVGEAEAEERRAKRGEARGRGGAFGRRGAETKTTTTKPPTGGKKKEPKKGARGGKKTRGRR